MNSQAHNFKDLSGKRFGRLLVIEFSHKNKYRNAVWKCVCDCENEVFVAGGNLKCGTSSCGCLRIERTIEAKTTHGKCRTSTYKTWESMLKRCRNKNDRAYKRYGALGITVRKEWEEFEKFYADMGDRPAGKTIDRIEGTKGYYKDNCRWATLQEQCANRSSNAIITIGAKSMCIAEWSRQSGIPQSTIWARISRGWSPVRSVFGRLDNRGSKKK